MDTPTRLAVANSASSSARAISGAARKSTPNSTLPKPLSARAARFCSEGRLRTFGRMLTGGSCETGSQDGASQATGEVFVDPATGQRMRVWYGPKTGQRDYRPE